MMLSFKALSASFEKKLQVYSFPECPNSLYEPLKYILSLGGKRVRPLLLMAAYNLYKDDPEYVFEAALSVEFFHNFSLLHDDIMDDADLRRGKPSVHIQFDTNSAILSGDVMLVKAYELLEKYSNEALELFKIFT